MLLQFDFYEFRERKKKSQTLVNKNKTNFHIYIYSRFFVHYYFNFKNETSNASTNPKFYKKANLIEFLIEASLLVKIVFTDRKNIKAYIMIIPKKKNIFWTAQNLKILFFVLLTRFIIIFYYSNEIIKKVYCIEQNVLIVFIIRWQITSGLIYWHSGFDL